MSSIAPKKRRRIARLFLGILVFGALSFTLLGYAIAQLLGNIVLGALIVFTLVLVWLHIWTYYVTKWKKIVQESESSVG